MPNTRRPLTDEELADAARLRAVWEKRSKDLDLTQLDVSKSFGFANQSAVSQYLNAKIPLNLEAALRFATILQVPVSSISTRYNSLLNSDNNYRKRNVLGVPVNDDLIEVTDAMKEVVGNFTWIVIDKDQTRLSNGLFAVQVGDRVCAVECKLVDGVFHVHGAGGVDMKIPAESAQLMNILGKVTHKFLRC
jgi:hypothetical protein